MNLQPQEIILYNPFDAHMHWRRKNGLLSKVAKYSINQFSGGLLMPNTSPKIITYEELGEYTREVDEEIGDKQFFPIFTYYLCKEFRLIDLRIAWKNNQIHAVKYYPEGGTTDSDKGLKGFYEVRDVLEEMQKLGIPLLIHGETPELNGEVVGDFKREKVFMETELVALVKEFPRLRIVLEHITTKAAVDFVMAHTNVIATITPQHCLLDDRALFNGLAFKERTQNYTLKQGGMNPSLMCRPILKDVADVYAIQAALIRQAREGGRKFYLGTDTAPHMSENKYKEGCACGMFTAPIALEMYAIAFEQMGILDHLQVFASDIAAEFYGIKDVLPRKKIILSPEPQLVQSSYDGIVTPFAGMEIPWTATAA